jgi:hypothetical protein
MIATRSAALNSLLASQRRSGCKETVDDGR